MACIIPLDAAGQPIKAEQVAAWLATRPGKTEDDAKAALAKKWRAQVRRRGAPSKAKTFKTKKDADKWGRIMDAGIDEGKVSVIEPARVTVAKLIQTYRDMRAAGNRPIGEQANEHYMLNGLERLLGEYRVAELSVSLFVEWARKRTTEGAGGCTIEMEVSKLATVFKQAATELDVLLPDVFTPVRARFAHLRMTAPANKRDRRPTQAELVAILAHMAEQPEGLIYAAATAFAAMSCMRRSEICRIEWADYDAADHVVHVRGRKDPRKAGGINEDVPLVDAAITILEAQARTDARCFPINGNVLGERFRDACKALGIKDLHFHDLRHEGTSLLFEEGFGVAQVAKYTGHKNWDNLSRYTNLRSRDMRLSAEELKARAKAKRHAVQRAVVGPRLKVVGE